MSDETHLLETLNQALEGVRETVEERDAHLRLRETGTVLSVGEGVAVVDGLPHVQSEELVRFPGGVLGLAFNLDPGAVGVVLLDESDELVAGMEAHRTGRVLDVPVGEAVRGRIVDPLGRPLDGRGPLRADSRLPVERPAPAVMDRAPVTVPLQTGLKSVDALIPIGRGQRELILGDRQTGKTAIALGTIINQRGFDVHCIYCAIGQRSSSIAKVVAQLREADMLERCTVVVTSEDDAPGLRFVAPYAAMSMGEFYRDRGEDALVVFDDLTRHARAYREVSLLLRRPPGREAYPGDIFYIHSRLLERSTHLREDLSGGSLTALPIIETQAQNISAYVPTNLISITDGQIYLSPDLFQKGIMPAADVGRSVSRVGGKTQLPAYRDVAGDLRLAYAQFEELESFARFGTRLDEETRQTLARGRRVREVLKQAEDDPWRAAEQIAVLLAVVEGLFDDIALERIAAAESRIRKRVIDAAGDVCDRIEKGEKLEDDERDRLRETIRRAIEDESDQNHGDT